MATKPKNPPPDPKDRAIEAEFVVRNPPGRPRALANLPEGQRSTIRPTIAPGASPWEKQPQESRQAYEAFTVYRAQGKGERSIMKTAKEMAKGRQQLGRWSSRWSWVARCQAWDAYCLDAADEAARKAVADEAMEIRREQNVVLRQQLQAGRALMRECLRAIQTEKGKKDPDARNLALAGQALDRAIAAQRLATGMPTELTRQDVNLRKTVEEAMETQKALTQIVEEILCDECRARIGHELGRLRIRQRTIRDQLGVV